MEKNTLKWKCSGTQIVFFNVTGVNLNVVLNCNLNIFVFHPGLQSSSITWSINQKLHRSPENSIFRPLLAASFHQRPVLTSCWSWKLAGIKQKRAALRFSDRIEQTLLGDGDTYYHCRVVFVFFKCIHFWSAGGFKWDIPTLHCSTV